MKEYKLTKEKKLSKHDLTEVLRILSKGGVIVVPTDTSYGLAALINKKPGLEKIWKMKGRQKEKTVSMAVRGQSQALEYGVVSCKPKALWKAFLPGPLTLVVWSKKAKLPYIRRNDNTLAIRQIPTAFFKQLLRSVPVPVSSTSANLSGKKDIYSLKEFLAQWKDAKLLPDAFINAGVLPKRKPSTVVRALKGEDIVVLRKGPISEKQIREALEKH